MERLALEGFHAWDVGQVWTRQESDARDHRDASRKVGPLSVPDDARVIDTTQMTQDQVVDEIVSQVRARQTV